MIKNFFELLLSQPPSLWLSMIATLISISGFALSYKNSRQNRRLDSLERRTKLLTKLSEVKSKIVVANMNFLLTISVLQRIKEIATLDNEEDRQSIIESEKLCDSIQKSILELTRGADILEAKLGTLTEKADSSEIEKLIPHVHRIQSEIENGVNLIVAANRTLEDDAKRLQTTGNHSGAT